jgi:hypothetical protein
MPENFCKYGWGRLAAALAMCLWLFNSASAPIAWAVAPQAAEPPQAAAGLTLTVRAGFDGYYKDGQWMPIRVTLANDGPEVSGTLKVKVPHNNAETLYTRPVALPTQSRREFFFYVPPEGYFSSPLKIDLVAGNKILASASVRLAQATSADYLYGILASSPSAFNSLADIDPINGQGYVAQLEPGDLPPLAAGWKALDLLVISDVDTGAFSPEQRQALEDWVLQGGHLVVVGGPAWQKTSAGLGPLLPLAASGTQSVADLGPLGGFAGSIAPNGPALAAAGQLTPDAITLVKTDELPAVVYRRLGFGLVAFLAFDPALAPLKGWDGVTGIFRGLLTIGLDRPNWANGFFNWSSANEAARAVPGLAVPSAWQVCGFLSVYVIVIGPLNFLVLRRLKRRAWAWITIPGVVVLFSVGAYITGYGLRGTQAVLHRLAVVEVWPNAARARAEQIVGIFSPQRTTYEVNFEPGTLAKPIPYGGGVPSLAPTVVEQGDRTRLPAIRTEIGAVEAFVAQSQVPAPRFDANLTLRLSNTGGSGLAMLAGTVTNQSDLTLSDAVLLVPGSVERIADIKPGQLVNVPPLYLAPNAKAIPANPNTLLSSLASPIGKMPPAYYGADNTFVDILGIPYPTNQEQYRRNALLSSILDQYGGGVRGYGVYLVGWTSTSPLGADVSVPFRTLDMSLYLIALPYTLDAGQGTIVLPPGLLTWSPLNLNQNNYTPYDIYLDPNSEIGFEYAPGLPVPIKSVHALTLHLLSNGLSGPATTVRVQLYDVTEDTWVEQPGVVWGDTPMAAPTRFVGPHNNVLVRIKNTSGMSLNIAQADFTLEAER